MKKNWFEKIITFQIISGRRMKEFRMFSGSFLAGLSNLQFYVQKIN